MAKRYGLSSENKGAVDTALDFPKLSLKKGEVARIAIFGMETDEESGKKKLVVPAPEGGYFFSLENPYIDKGYKGAFECLASEELKMEDEYDPDACPHCEYVLEGKVSEEVMGPRKRRHVLPVIRYKTKPKSSEIITPPSVEVIAWRFTDRYFNQLVDIHEEWEADGGLLKHDLSLTCEAEQYQNYNIAVLPEAAYTKSKDMMKLVLETFASQTADLKNGLIRQLGTSLNEADLRKRIEETLESVNQATGGSAEFTQPSVDPQTIEEMSADLLGETSDGADEASDEEPVTVPSTGGDDDGFDFDSFFDS